MILRSNQTSVFHSSLSNLLANSNNKRVEISQPSIAAQILLFNCLKEHIFHNSEKASNQIRYSQSQSKLAKLL